MASEIITCAKTAVAYCLLPYLRNQDTIFIKDNIGNYAYVASVVDGFNFREKIHGNTVGKKAARLVAETFPKIFVETQNKNLKQRALKAAKIMDKDFLQHFPKYVSAVGTFLFNAEAEDILVAIGTINTWIWKDGLWERPKEISNYVLPYPKYYSGSRTFFGLGEIKRGSFYSAQPDVVVVPTGRPVLIATDGLDDVLSLEEINEITRSVHQSKPAALLAAFVQEIEKRQTQKDDISLFLRGLP